MMKLCFALVLLFCVLSSIEGRRRHHRAVALTPFVTLFRTNAVRLNPIADDITEAVSMLRYEIGLYDYLPLKLQLLTDGTIAQSTMARQDLLLQIAKSQFQGSCGQTAIMIEDFLKGAAIDLPEKGDNNDGTPRFEALMAMLAGDNAQDNFVCALEAEAHRFVLEKVGGTVRIYQSWWQKFSLTGWLLGGTVSYADPAAFVTMFRGACNPDEQHDVPARIHHRVDADGNNILHAINDDHARMFQLTNTPMKDKGSSFCRPNLFNRVFNCYVRATDLIVGQRLAAKYDSGADVPYTQANVEDLIAIGCTDVKAKDALERTGGNMEAAGGRCLD